MPNEIWKPVPGYEGLYEVSDRGQVRSLDRMCPGRDGRSELHRGKVLRPQKLKNGYLEVKLRKDGASKHGLIHHLVAAAFLGARPSGHDVLHRDGRRQNNAVENLSYGTRAENLHSTYAYGGRQASGKLSLRDVSEIRQRISAGEGDRTIVECFGVHPAAIYHIRVGKTFAWFKEED